MSIVSATSFLMKNIEQYSTSIISPVFSKHVLIHHQLMNNGFNKAIIEQIMHLRAFQ